VSWRELLDKVHDGKTHSLTVVSPPLKIDLQQDVGRFADREEYDRQNDRRDERDQRVSFDRRQIGNRRDPCEIEIFDVVHIESKSYAFTRDSCRSPRHDHA
jgi:hypothetical protein